MTIQREETYWNTHRRNASRRTKKDDKRHKEVSDEDEEDDQENEMPSEADRMEVESV